MKKYRIVVTLSDETAVPDTFTGDVHVATCDAELILDRVVFYDKWRKKPWGFPHHEIVIIEPRVWLHQHAQKIHTHANPSGGERLVCFVERIPDTPGALEMFKTWALGTAYTMRTGDDFGPVFEEDKDHAAFARRIKERCKLEVTNAHVITGE